jgi:hypothetical protein
MEGPLIVREQWAGHQRVHDDRPVAVSARLALLRNAVRNRPASVLSPEVVELGA